MSNLIKMEKYQLLHNLFYGCGGIIVFLLGFFTADTYVPEVMGPEGGVATSLVDIFNGMVYDTTFLLILLSSILALVFGQEFSCRTIDLEIGAGHSRKAIFTSKIVVYLFAFNIMALIYPIAGCLREFGKFGIEDVTGFIYNVIKATGYSFLLNSTSFFIAIIICFYLQSSVKAIAVTAIVNFILSIYLGYGMMLKLPVAFLTTFQIREVISTQGLIQLPAILIGITWICILVFLSWIKFRKCDLK